ncbi:MAG: radical SAM protein [Elusimicrobia bacterium]|nr:radical SAM protein [Candidatus Liberimonas magnetica]
MNILIINSNNTRKPVPVMPIGACRVAEAAEQAGHTVRFLDLMFEKDIASAVRNEVKKHLPGLIGISVRNIDNNSMPNPVSCYKQVQEITEAIRSVSCAPVILGGTAVGIMPEAYLKLTEAEGAVSGPGEFVFPEIIQSFEDNVPIDEIKGLITLKHTSAEEKYDNKNISASVYRTPDFKKWLNMNTYTSHLASIPVQTKQGCPFKCIYCTYGMCEGNRFDAAPVEKVIERIKLLSLSGLKDIEFTDAVFNYPYEHAFELCEGLIKAHTGARFQTYNLNPGFMDKTLLDVMEKAGFYGIGISAESGSNRVLRGLQKNYTLEDLTNAAEALQESKLPCFWMFILGGPKETEESIDETLEFAQKYVKSKDVALLSLGLRIYPGTGLEALAREEGLLTAKPEEMLEPLTYISPLIEQKILANRIERAIHTHLNYIDSGFLQSPLLNTLLPLVHLTGLSRPLWKHTNLLRRSLRMIGTRL